MYNRYSVNVNRQKETLAEKRAGKGWHPRTQSSVGKDSSPSSSHLPGCGQNGKNRDLAATRTTPPHPPVEPSILTVIIFQEEMAENTILNKVTEMLPCNQEFRNSYYTTTNSFKHLSKSLIAGLEQVKYKMSLRHLLCQKARWCSNTNGVGSKGHRAN